MRTTPGTIRPAVAALGVLAVLTACASGDAEPGESPTADPVPTAEETPGAAPTGPEPSPGAWVLGLPEGVTPQTESPAGAGRTEDDMLLHVVTFGSSTCPAVPDPTADLTGSDAVTVTFPDPGDGPCTQDYVPATAVVALPDGVDPEAELTVTVGIWGDVTLPAGSTEMVWTPAGG